MPGKKTIFILALVTVITGIGVSGYMLIEGWGFSDSLYMTIITLTTAGYSEVHQLSEGGRYFTMFLLVSGMGIVAYSAGVTMNYFLNIDFSKRRRDKMQKRINQLSGHTIICGFGRMGQVIASELFRENVDFVVIENNHELIERMKEKGYLWIEGDAAQEENLELAQIKNAKILVSMIDNDSDSLYISLSARSLNTKLQIISRAQDEVAKKRILKAGANKVVLPIVMSGLRVADLIINPAVEDFLDISDVNFTQSDRIQMSDMTVTADSMLVGGTLKEFGGRMNDLVIIGIKKEDKSFIFKPGSKYIFVKGDCLIAMGKKAAYENALKEFQLE